MIYRISIGSSFVLTQYQDISLVGLVDLYYYMRLQRIQHIQFVFRPVCCPQYINNIDKHAHSVIRPPLNDSQT